MDVFLRAATGIVLPALLTALAGCSVERFAANRVADTLAASGSTYAVDDDPELVGDALPFGLKLMESVLDTTPEHRVLLASACAGFTQYAWGWVQQEADALALDDPERAWDAWRRARNLYLRARDYGLRGLEVRMPGFGAALRGDAAAAAARAGAAEVDLLYWTGASWAGAISLAKDDPSLVAELPLVSALIDRALAVDGDWDRGAIHAFLVSYTMARPDVDGDRVAAARVHYDRAVELSGGQSAAPYLSWAESVCLPAQDRACFDAALAQAMQVDPDAHPPTRLANLVLQRRARWLAQHAERWILPALDEEAPHGEDGEP